MSLFTDASLVYVPSGVKDAKTYSIVPTDGSGDLTFSRGSDIEATRVNSQGYIQKATVNLLLQSNTFSTSWTISNASITGGQADKDGGTSAWKLEATTNSPQIQQSISAGGVTTYSVYAKAGTNDWIRLLVVGSTNYARYFNLSNGTKGSSVYSTEIDSNIVSVGGGWYRVDITTNSTITAVRIFTADGDGTQSTTSSGYIYIQDAQVNYGLVAQDYVETTTAAVVAGITNDMPRLNYDPANPTCPSLLLEPSRTNVVTQSEYAANTLQNVTASYVESPEGVNNALRITENSSTGQHYAEFNANVVSGTTYTISFFCKEGSYSQFSWPTQGSYMTGSISVNFDTQTASVTGSDMVSGSAFMEPYPNGWYRVGFSGVPKITGNMDMYISISPNGVGSYTGDGVSYTDFYGFQCEAGSYATSYIPTYGTSATRTLDRFTKTGISSIINSQEGTLFVEMAAPYSSIGTTLLSINDGTVNNHLYMGFTSTTNNISSVFSSGGAVQAVFNTSNYDVKEFNKIAVSYKANEVKMYINGTLIATDTNATMPAAGTLTKFSSDYGQNSFPLQANIKQAIIFPTALTNAQMAELTA